MKQYREALSVCESALKKDPNNVKALYRAGMALVHLGEMEDAVVKLQRALVLNPEDKTIQTELKKAIKKNERTLQEEKELYRRMVGTQPLPKSSPSTTSHSSSWVCT